MATLLAQLRHHHEKLANCGDAPDRQKHAPRLLLRQLKLEKSFENKKVMRLALSSLN